MGGDLRPGGADAIGGHVLEELGGDLGEDLLGQSGLGHPHTAEPTAALRHKVPERHELDNVPHRLLARRRTEPAKLTILKNR